MEYDGVDQKSPSMPRKNPSSHLTLRGRGGMARLAHHWRWIMMICIMFPGGLLLSSAIPQPLVQSPEANSIISEEPITPIPEPPPIDASKVRLGERLFGDPRLSRDNSRSCSSCHDLGANGATKVSHDMGFDGSNLPLNTPTVFNATLNFRFGWEGKIRTIESDVKASLENPQIMGANISELAERLGTDPALQREFAAVYGRGPDSHNVVDAIASFVANPGNTWQPVRPLAGRRCRRPVGARTGRVSPVQILRVRLLSPRREHRRKSFPAPRNIPPAGVAKAGNSAGPQSAQRRSHAALFS